MRKQACTGAGAGGGRLRRLMPTDGIAQWMRYVQRAEAARCL